MAHFLHCDRAGIPASAGSLHKLSLADIHSDMIVLYKYIPLLQILICRLTDTFPAFELIKGGFLHSYSRCASASGQHLWMLRSMRIRRVHEGIAAVGLLVSAAWLHVFPRSVVGPAEIAAKMMRSRSSSVGEAVVFRDLHGPVHRGIDLFPACALPAYHRDLRFCRLIGVVAFLAVDDQRLGVLAVSHTVDDADRDGDEVAFGRVVAEPGSWVNIMNDGTLFVTEASLGNSSSGANQTSNKVKITRQVPPDSYYVLGDAEDATISGLANAEDFVMTDQVIGKTLFKVWPITSFGPVN